MTATSDLITQRLSFGFDNLRIGADDQSAVVAALHADRNIDATLRDLGNEGMGLIFNRMGGLPHIRGALQIIAGRAQAQRSAARSAVERAMRPAGGGMMGGGHVGTLQRPSTWFGAPATVFFDVCAGLGDAVRNQGLGGTASCPAPSSSYTGRTATSPFSGVGASGVNATTLSVALSDQALMALGNETIRERYSNPLGGLGSYLSSLTAAQRLGQARQLVCQPASSIMPLVYPSTEPSRALVLSKAGRRYNLEPHLIAAIILAEQRDQTRNEDAVEYTAATSLLGKNTSIGLGQVLVSTAQRHDLFRDLGTSPATGVPRNLVAAMLTSDEFSIYATAAYIRKVADQASRIPIATLPRVQAEFPAINMAAYANNSSTWPHDNVMALGMEYTSAPWDGSLTGAGWGWFVGEGYKTLKSGGIAFP